MKSTTYAGFNTKTEGADVVAAFPGAVKGKTVLITGVSKAGIGYSVAEALATQAPSNLILSGRSDTRVQGCVDSLASRYPRINIRPLTIDLSSQSSVRTGAMEVLSWSEIPSIDIVINNAGIMHLPKRELSPEGIEMHFATNHLGHFLLTCLLMPKLITAAKSNDKKCRTRIINLTTSNSGLCGVRFSDINLTKPLHELPPSEQHPLDILTQSGGAFDPETATYIPASAYISSKTANVLFGIALSDRLAGKYGILSIAADPGLVNSELGRNLLPARRAALMELVEKEVLYMKTLSQGASTPLTAALDPGLDVSEVEERTEGWGVFLADCQFRQAPKTAVGKEEAEKLWALSEELVGEKFCW